MKQSKKNAKAGNPARKAQPEDTTRPVAPVLAGPGSDAKQDAEPMPETAAPTPETTRLQEAQKKAQETIYGALSPFEKPLWTRHHDKLARGIPNCETMPLADVVTIPGLNPREVMHLGTDENRSKEQGGTILGGLRGSLAMSGQEVACDVYTLTGKALAHALNFPAFRGGKPLTTPIDSNTPVLMRGARRTAGMLANFEEFEKLSPESPVKKLYTANPFAALYIVRHTEPLASLLEIARAYGDNNSRENPSTLYEEAKQAAQFRDAGLTQAEIGTELGMSQGNVQVRLRLWGLPNNESLGFVRDEARKFYLTQDEVRRGTKKAADLDACVKFTNKGINRLSAAFAFHCEPKPGKEPKEKIGGVEKTLPPFTELWKDAQTRRDTEAYEAPDDGPKMLERADVIALRNEIIGAKDTPVKLAYLALIGFIVDGTPRASLNPFIVRE